MNRGFTKTRNTKLIVTIGPASKTKQYFRIMKDKAIDFLRINMSHSSFEDFVGVHILAREVGIDYIIDTEGPQIRTACLNSDSIFLENGEKVEIRSYDNLNATSPNFESPIDIEYNNLSEASFSLNPGYTLIDLVPGNIIYINTEGPVVQVTDTSTASSGYVSGKVIISGKLFDKKAVFIDGKLQSRSMPILSEKDLEAVRYGLREKISYIALSYVRSGADVDSVREITENRMRIISKVENRSALRNIDEIIDKSDFLLIDRGDMSKEIPSEKIPFIQQYILKKCKISNKGVFVATNLLESMILNSKPTRAEIQDITNAVLQDVYGLTLSAETAVGKHPIRCINTMDRVITHVESIKKENENVVVEYMSHNSDLPSDYLVDHFTRSTIEPHGGQLISVEDMDTDNLDFKSMPSILVDDDSARDIFQISMGGFSPITGFMNEEDLHSVLSSMKLSNGSTWPLPITLDVDQTEVDSIEIGGDYCLVNLEKEPLATIKVNQVYNHETRIICEAIYGTDDPKHPGVKRILKQAPFLVAGDLTSVNRTASIMSAYDFSPRQLRKLFYEQGWEKIAGFHTRNVPHKGHEYLLTHTIEEELCDGILVHPVVGSKKKGDFNSEYILKSYDFLINHCFPQDKFILSTFNTYSRYAGPREALFTALCRKNYGCTHFIVGRDHTGFSDHNNPKASQQLLYDIEDLGIEIITFNEVFYSGKQKIYFQSKNSDKNHDSKSEKPISGTDFRRYLSDGDLPPDWLVTREISMMLRDALTNGESVFVT